MSRLKAAPQAQEEALVGGTVLHWGASVATGGVLGQRWRWRLLSMSVLPGYGERDALLAPAQALQLRVPAPLDCCTAHHKQAAGWFTRPLLLLEGSC